MNCKDGQDDDTGGIHRPVPVAHLTGYVAYCFEWKQYTGAKAQGEG